MIVALRIFCFLFDIVFTHVVFVWIRDNIYFQDHRP